jgi:sugar phosphate permease
MKIKNLRWIIIGLIFLSTVINFIDRNSLAIMWPRIGADTGVSRQSYATIVSIFMVFYAIGQAGAGRLIDRVGARLGFLLSIFVWSIACGLHARARGVLSLAAFRALLGLSEAGSWPGAAKAIAEWFPRHERALAQGIFNAGTALGGAVSGPVIAWLFMLLGWRATFLVVAALGFLWIAPWWIIARSTPATHPWITREELDCILNGENAPRPQTGAIQTKPGMQVASGEHASVNHAPENHASEKHASGEYSSGERTRLACRLGRPAQAPEHAPGVTPPAARGTHAPPEPAQPHFGLPPPQAPAANASTSSNASTPSGQSTSSNQSAPSEQSSPSEPATGMTWSQAASHRQTWSVVVSRFFIDPVWWFFLSWLPIYFHDRFGFEIKDIGASVFATYTCAAVGSLSGGWFSGFMMQRGRTVDRARKRAVHIGAALMVPALVVAAFAAAPALAIAAISAACFGFQFLIGNIQTLPSDFYSGKSVGTVAGMGGMSAVLGTLVFSTCLVPALSGISYTCVFLLNAALVPLAVVSLHCFAGVIRRVDTPP